MQKGEAVHLHALLAELRTQLEERSQVEPEAFSSHDELGVSPLQAHRSRDKHVEALRILAATLAAELATESTCVADEERRSKQSAQHANGEY